MTWNSGITLSIAVCKKPRTNKPIYSQLDSGQLRDSTSQALSQHSWLLLAQQDN